MRVRIPKLGALICATWLDAVGYIGTSQSEAKPAKCNTVGWLVAVNDDHIVIATSIYDDGSGGDYTVLPLGMITKIEVRK